MLAPTAITALTRARIFDGKRVMLVLRDYLDGVAPPIPTLDLEMEQGQSVVVNQIMQRYDSSNKIESWVFSMRGDRIADLYELGGLRLLARNIRGFLGEGTPVNRGMSETLRTEPAHFFYYNNGITILCDKAEKRSSKGRDVLRVSNPQVINGQQTTRTLAAHAKESAQASVLVKVMQVPRETGKNDDGFNALLSKIVGGTNFQNAIRPSDLMSNDRRQIEIERSFRKLGYIYLRKRQNKGDAKKKICAWPILSGRAPPRAKLRPRPRGTCATIFSACSGCDAPSRPHLQKFYLAPAAQRRSPGDR